MEYKDQAIAQSKESEFDITLKHNSEDERAVKDLLELVLRKYPVEKWVRTRKIVIEEGTRPHSHPVLTLSVRTRTEEGLLAMFLHEQIHWIEHDNHEPMYAAIEELKVLFPNAPIGGLEGGDNEQSTYRHLIICRLEYLALVELLGEEKATDTVKNQRGYQWMRRMGREGGDKIDPVIEKYFPETLK